MIIGILFISVNAPFYFYFYFSFYVFSEVYAFRAGGSLCDSLTLCWTSHTRYWQLFFVLRLEHCRVFLFPQCQPPRCGSTLSLYSCPPIGAGYKSFVSFHFISLPAKVPATLYESLITLCFSASLNHHIRITLSATL